LFVAIALPDAVQAALMDVQRELKSVLPRHSTAWTKPESLHLTLRFLGNVESTRIAELAEKLGRGMAGFGEFDLVSERLGCFPDLRYPRVVWAWVHDAGERLAQLQRRVNEAVAGFAEQPAEARFVGHITLARPRQIKRADAGRLARFVSDAVSRKFGDWRVQSVALIRSQLSEAGARYEEVAQVNLR
jgi:2'-5' RNA ligase